MCSAAWKTIKWKIHCCLRNFITENKVGTPKRTKVRLMAHADADE